MKRRAVVFLVGRVDAVVGKPEADEQAIHGELALEGAHDRDRPAAADQRRGLAPFGLQRAIFSAWFLTGSEMAGLPAWPMNSALTSVGRREVTKVRNAWTTRSGFCLPTSRKVSLALALAGSTVLVPSPV